MTVRRALTFIACFISPVVAVADDFELPFAGDNAGCMEGPMEQFGRYIGDWKIKDSQLVQDGSGWSDSPGWNWKLEFSTDEGTTWFEAYRIRAELH